MKTRNELISFLQAFGITLVVLGHSFLYVPDNPVMRYIYSFHMPLFMFISGYLLIYSAQARGQKINQFKILGTNGFFWKKTKRLLIPYVAISSLTLIPKYFLNQYTVRPTDISFDAWAHMLLYPWDNVINFFWFLPTLFAIMCIVVVTVKLSARFRIGIPDYAVLSILAILHVFNPAGHINLLNFSGIIGYLFYFVLGIIFCTRQREIIKFFRLNTPPPPQLPQPR